MQGAQQGSATYTDGSALHIGIVQARFNEGITNALAAACLDELAQLGVPASQIHHVTVPGALEVPAALQVVAESARFVALGAEAPYVHAWGNLKFDLTVPASAHEQAEQWRRWWGEQRPVWIAASTHPEEETQVLTAHRHVLAEQPDALLVLAPRHPERLPAVLADVEQAGFSALCRSALAPVPQAPSPDTPAPAAGQVLVVDTLGELITFYAASVVAFVGGSLVPVGGHNPLEPLTLGKPTVTGPCVFNFDAVYAELTALEGTTTGASARGLGQHVAELLAQPERRALPATVVAWLQANQGSTARLLAYADQLVRRLEAAKAALQQP